LSRDYRPLVVTPHDIWYARKELVLLEQYVPPMVASYGELKVLTLLNFQSLNTIELLPDLEPFLVTSNIVNLTRPPKADIDDHSLS
jgi:hypothetical protein